MVKFILLIVFSLVLHTFIKGAIPADTYYNNNGYPVYIFDLNCTGTEDSIWDCSYNQTTQSCSHKTYSNKDASVICQS